MDKLLHAVEVERGKACRKAEHGGGRNRVLELKIPTDARPGHEQRIIEGKEGQCRLGKVLAEEWPCPRNVLDGKGFTQTG